MHVRTLNLKVQVLPAFAPQNKKRIFVKESAILNVHANLFTPHLERANLPKRVLNSLSDVLVSDDANSTTLINLYELDDKKKTLKSLSTFSVGAIPLSWKQSIVSTVISDPSAEDKVEGSSRFSQLLNLLVEVDKNLIVDMDGDLAVLQPTSCSLATLTYLKRPFYLPAKKLFEGGNAFHLSKKMVAALLEEVMSIKSYAPESSQHDSNLAEEADLNTPNQETLEKSSEGNSGGNLPAAPSSNGEIDSVLAEPPKNIPKTSKISKHLTSDEINKEIVKQQSFNERAPVGVRKAKRGLQDCEDARPLKKMKMSTERCSPRTKKGPKMASSRSMTRNGGASWRGQLILEKSMELRRKSFLATADEDTNSCHSESFGKTMSANPTSRRSDVAPVIVPEGLETEEHLLEFLRSIYQKVLEGDSTPLSGARNIVGTTIQYFSDRFNVRDKPDDRGSALESTYNILFENILSSITKLKEKHARKTTPEELKLKELQLQVLLQCEVDAECSSLTRCCDVIEQRHDEVVAMMRSMIFIKDTTYLSTFLGTVMLDNYHQTSPRFLYKIYDSLLQPLPTQLEYLMSPDKLDDEFLMTSPTLPDKNFASLITNPKIDETEEMELEDILLMEKRTRLAAKNQRSLPFTEAPRVKIELPVAKKIDAQHRRSERIASATKAGRYSGKEEVIKARRTLFKDHKSPEPSPTKKHKTPNKTMPAHYVLKTKKVRETPVDRQGPKQRLKRQEKLLENMNSSDVWCVDDTPEKECLAGKDLSLSQPARIIAETTRFYSNNREVRKFADLEKRMTEARSSNFEQNPASPTLGRSGWSQPLDSPKRRVTARVLFGSPSGPSPDRAARVSKDADKNETTSASPSFGSPKRRSETFKTPENVKAQPKQVPSNLLKARRAILTSPSLTRKSPGNLKKVASPKLATPSPKGCRTRSTPKKS